MKKIIENFKLDKKKRKKKFELSFTNVKVKNILILSFLLIGILPLTLVGYFTYQESRSVIQEGYYYFFRYF